MSSLVFKRISSDDKVVNYLADSINSRLNSNQKVLWLVSGGSAIKIAVGVSQKLKNNPNLANLTISLADERFGPAGHQDSNWTQLKNEGFSLKGADLQPVLRSKDKRKTAEDFEKMLGRHFTQADYCIALLGMGPDGHTSGILPGSPAVEADGLVQAYRGPDFERIASTPKALARLDEAVLYVVGEAKWPQLDRLEQSISITKQPVQVLKRLKKVIIFNDYKGEPA